MLSQEYYFKQFKYLRDQHQLSQQKQEQTKRLDDLPFSKWHFYMTGSLGATWIFDGYEVSMLSLVVLQLQNYFDKSKSEVSAIFSFYLAGCCIGALIFGSLATVYGRKKLFLVTLIIYGISVIGATFSTNYYEFIAFRFMTGIGVGGEYTAIFAAVDELVPAIHRGRSDIIIDGTWHFGSFLASIFSIIIQTYWKSTNISWKYMQESQQNQIFFLFHGNPYMFAFGALGTIPIMILRKNIPESPRWLLSQRRFLEATFIIDFIQYQCKHNTIMSLNDYKENVAQKQSNISEYLQSGRKKSYLDFSKEEESLVQMKLSENLKIIFHTLIRIYPQRFILGLVLMSSQAFFYQGIFYTFGMNLNTFYGVPQEHFGYYQIPLSVASFTGPLILGKYFDTIGRKLMVFITYMSVAILLTLFSILFQLDFLNLPVLIILLTIIFTIASPGASSAHCIVSEIFPSEMRSQVLAIFFSIGLGIGGIISPIIFGALIEKEDRNYLALGYYLAAFIMAVAGIVGYIYGVNAEGKSLEDISNFVKYEVQNDEKIDNRK